MYLSRFEEFTKNAKQWAQVEVWRYIGLLVWLVKAMKEWQANQGRCGWSIIVVGVLIRADVRCAMKELDSDVSPVRSR